MLDFLRYASYHKWTTSRNKDGFHSQFIEESKFGGAKGMRLGSEVSRLLEFDPTNPLVADIPRYAIPEFPLVTTIRGVPCISHPDSFCPFTLSIYEYKTAVEKYKWTQAKAIRHEQLVFYLTLIRSMFGSVNKTCHLVEIRTKNVKEDTKQGALSKHIDEYEREIDEITGLYLAPIKWPVTVTDKQMDEMEEKIVKTWTEIQEHIKKNQYGKLRK